MGQFVKITVKVSWPEGVSAIAEMLATHANGEGLQVRYSGAHERLPRFEKASPSLLLLQMRNLADRAGGAFLVHYSGTWPDENDVR